jgi:alpha-ribazole phosphatase
LIYLIRHTAPLVEKGICYGQTDLDVKDSFLGEAAIIKNVLPSDIANIYTSPLQRCNKLAIELFPNHTITHNAKLMELHCGDWEMQHWDDIPKNEIDPWYNDFVHYEIPNGESYTTLYNRVVNEFEHLRSNNMDKKIAIVAHGGVLRSILSHITKTSLLDSFDAFKIHYGCVVEIAKNEDAYYYEILSNIETAKEQHQPTKSFL